MRTVNAEYMGQDPTSAAPTNGAPAAIDLRPVNFGGATFTNPCFWILIGVIGTIAAQWLLSQKRHG